MPIPAVVKSFNDWVVTGSDGTVSDNAAIERVMDNAAYTSAHPDDTFVFAGPPRLSSATGGVGDEGVYGAFASVGMLQNITVNQSKPFQPMMAIGSARSFYLGGKAQGSAQVGRLFMNTQSLMQRLYDNILLTSSGAASTIRPSFADGTSGNPAFAALNPNYVINLDSELFLIPFGLGVIFKNKARSAIGGFYMELVVIPNYTVSVSAGQAMIMEGVALLFDRLYPLSVAASDDFLKKLDTVIAP